MKMISYFLQAALLKLIFIVFTFMTPKMASKLGGEIMVLISSILRRQNEHAFQNLFLIYPDKTKQKKHTIIKEMWRNVGMNLGEYPHLKKAFEGHSDFKIEITGKEYLNGSDKPNVYISAHTGNWEILPLSVAKLKRPFYSLYRPPNNPFIRDELDKLRTLNGILPDAYTKGQKGLVSLARHVKQGEDIGILLDQRHSGGENVLFFDHDVDASYTPVDLALKYDANIILGRIIRHDACAFTLEILPPLDTKTRTRTDIMQDIYDHYEVWINEYPSQWLWMHRRWGKNI